MVSWEAAAAIAVATFSFGSFVAGLVRRARARGSDDLSLTTSVAALTARDLGHDHVTPEHFVLAAICDDEIARSHVGSDAALAWMRGSLLERLDALGKSRKAKLAVAPALAAALRRAQQMAHAAGRPHPTTDDVMRELASTDAYEVSTLLARARSIKEPAPPPASTRNVADAPYRSHEPARAVPVVVWNDARTTMKLVEAILRDVFHKSGTEAVHAMLTVHRKGQAIVGRYDEDEAKRLVDAATKRARDAGAPLRITLGDGE